MSLSCDIKFDSNAHGVFFPGDLLSGEVHITLEKPKKCKGISLIINGSAVSKWTDYSLKYRGLVTIKQTAEYKGREDYLSTINYLLPSNANDTMHELPAGRHKYTFACKLPTTLPTSFEGLYGYIRYTVKVILERSRKFDHTLKVAFTVLNELDLNSVSPTLLIPTEMETTNTFWCGACTSGQFRIVASLPQTGYVPGQHIVIHSTVTNHSSIAIKYMCFSLQRIVRYKSQLPAANTKREVDIVRERIVRVIQQRGQSVRQNFDATIDIPPIPPSNTELCANVMEITYEVMVEARLDPPHRSPCVVIPVMIGTVPLRRNAQDSLQTPTIVLTVPTANGQQMEVMENFPPVSYEESLRGQHIIEDPIEERHPIGQRPYTPRYALYNYGTMPSSHTVTTAWTTMIAQNQSVNTIDEQQPTASESTNADQLANNNEDAIAQTEEIADAGVVATDHSNEAENARHAAKLRENLQMLN